MVVGPGRPAATVAGPALYSAPNTSASSRTNFAAATALAPEGSNSGASSTTSAPTMRAPESFRAMMQSMSASKPGPPGSGLPVPGHLAGIQDVHVDGEIYGAVTDFLKDRFDPFGREGAQRLVRAHPFELIARARADAELMERADAMKT